MWTVSTWNVVRHALQEDCCSRIVVTTEINDVAQAWSFYKSQHNASHVIKKHILKMEPLNDDFSRDLLVSRVFGDKDKCPEELNEVSYEIARKCGGLPLATIAAASLLLSRPDKPDEWIYVQKSLIPDLRIQPTSEGMAQLLNNSFNNLPHHLKACMLYLSIYKEDHIINPDDLVKQWVAEDFVSATEGKSLDEAARNHFYELVHRGILETEHISCSDEVVSCTVHDMVLNFIKRKAMEENFVTAIDHSQSGIRLADKVRRLSLHFGYSKDAKAPACIRLSQLRSLVFSGFWKCGPSISEFHLLRVLFLHGKHGEFLDLTRIRELFLLTYLQIEGNVCIDLPSELQGLKYLRTLHIGAMVTFLRSEVVHLPPLLHFRLPPNLGYFVDAGSVQSIEELTNLQDLQLACPQIATSDHIKHNMKLLGSIIGILKSLKSLTVVPVCFSEDSNDNENSSIAIFLDFLDKVPPPCSLLQRLELFPRVCVFHRLPSWIITIEKLCILKVAVMELLRKDIETLSMLNALTVFSLYVRTTPAEPIIFDKSGFHVLKYFKFKCSTVSSLRFDEGAMPNLQRLKMEFNGSTVEQYNLENVGFKHLSGVKVSAKICIAGTSEANRMAIASVLNNAIRQNTRISSVIIRFINRVIKDLPIVPTPHTDHMHENLRLDKSVRSWPTQCDGCKELGAGHRFKCEQCNSKVYYDMCCATAPHTLKHPLFPGSVFRFLRKPLASECGRACDACGDLMHGFVYHCFERGLDLHPRCARLPVRTANVKGYVMELRRVSACSRCCICMCGKEGYRNKFWSYRSSQEGQDINVHMACLKDLASKSHETLTKLYEILMGESQWTPTEVLGEDTSDQLVVSSAEDGDRTPLRQDEITEEFQHKDEVCNVLEHGREELRKKETDTRSQTVTEPLFSPGQAPEEEPVAEPEMITHHDHPQHKLRLVTTTCDMPFRCDGCLEPGYAPRYRCDACNFDMHTFCSNLCRPFYSTLCTKAAYSGFVPSLCLPRAAGSVTPAAIPCAGSSTTASAPTSTSTRAAPACTGRSSSTGLPSTSGHQGSAAFACRKRAQNAICGAITPTSMARVCIST